jgi:protein tyrosine phosphatase
MQDELSMEEALQQLRNSFDVLVSLDVHDASKLTKVWEKNLKGKHHIVTVADFQAPTLSQLTEISDMISQAAAAKSSVVFHCRVGVGRTGTVLAALMLRSMMEQGAKNDLQKSVLLSLPLGRPSVETTPLVKQAVEAVRAYDTGGMSVETPVQVQALEFFEKQLLKIQRS